MSENKNVLNVLYSSNDYFSKYLGVSMYSMLKNNVDDFEKINIYVFDDEISEINKGKLEDIAKSFNQKLEFIEVFDIESKLGKVNFMLTQGVKSFTAYSRLFISTILNDIDKILYMDADSLVVGSFKDLWDIDIGDYYCAGVEDLQSIDTIKRDVGMGKENRYINTGFLLINLKMWREVNIETKFIDFQKKNNQKFIFWDQGIINGVCKEKIYYLPPKYNFISIFHGMDYKTVIKLNGIPDYYDEEIFLESQKNPIFLHFCGGDSQRPWINKSQIYYNDYFEYVKETDFKKNINYPKDSFKMEKIYGLYRSKFVEFFAKLIPMGLSVKLNNKRLARIVKKLYN